TTSANSRTVIKRAARLFFTRCFTGDFELLFCAFRPAVPFALGELCSGLLFFVGVIAVALRTQLFLSVFVTNRVKIQSMRGSSRSRRTSRLCLYNRGDTPL